MGKSGRGRFKSTAANKFERGPFDSSRDGEQRTQFRCAIKVGETLQQIDGIAVGGELRHDDEDRGADVWEF